ncbi:MAG TPA: sigma 54-interacting transcriptional regulator [Kofleriaceae bacterium]|nr:sigma 54-interacting transcriptional regulator [Kofleriaceae bacterium]
MVSGEIDLSPTDAQQHGADGRGGGVGEAADCAPAGERARDPARARRRWMLALCGVALAYTAAVIGLSLRSPELGFFVYRGSAVLSVDPAGPARAAGVEVGDRVTSLDGRRLATPPEVEEALGSIAPDRTVLLGVAAPGRGQRVLQLRAEKPLPWVPIAAALFAAFIMVLALLSDRGGPRPGPRQFFRQSLGIAFLLVGAFSWDVTMSHAVLSVPWMIALVTTPPMTCHFMMCHPAGREEWSRGQLAALYGPALLLGAALVAVELVLAAGAVVADHARLVLSLGGAVALTSAGYLTVGAVSRMRRVRRLRFVLGRGAVLWYAVSSVSASLPILALTAWALVDVQAVVAGGFRPLVGVAVVGGCTGAAMTLTDVPIGEIDRLLRRRTGHTLVTGLAAGVFLLLVAVAGGLASALSGGKFIAALAATLTAAFLFGPVREQAQRRADSRFGRDRERARRLLREAAEAALATLDVRELGARVVPRVRDALSAEGAALYAREGEGPGGPGAVWRRIALDGAVPIGDPLPRGDTIAGRLDRAAADGAPRTLCADIVAVPVAAEAGEGGRGRAHPPHALVVSPRDSGELGDEDRELLSTLAAQLAVALGNARAHEDLARMRDEAERRRHEIARLKDLVEEENRRLLRQLASPGGHEVVVGPGLRETFELVRRVARTDSTALLRGETGCGKEVVARALHAASARAGRPFVVVDCGALPAGLVESALFGHERGAFTGAVSDASGAFRSADGGTIFLDEIGELPLALQPVLLRALQEREVRPVGATGGVRVDVRVVAGTHRDLAALVAEGRFRDDLWYRLRVVEIDLPPLRERRDDVLPLAEHFLTRAALRSGRPRKRLTAGARVALLEHLWPGNVRELEHAIEAATVYATDDEILAAHLPIHEAILRCRGRQRLKRPRPRAQEGLREALDGLERERVLEVLREQGGNRSRAARALGISRGALLRRLTRYGVEPSAS